MKHFHLDEFTKIKSPVHGIDPRIKLVSLLILIISLSFMQNILTLIAAGIFLALLIFIARIPLSFVVSRLAWTIPFTGILVLIMPFVKPGTPIWHGNLGLFNLTATREGLLFALLLAGRLGDTLLTMVVLIGTTSFRNILRAMGDLRVPSVIIQLMEFTVRYLLLFQNEARKMQRARKSRGFIAGKNLWHLPTIKNMAELIGVLFIRAYERGERVYLAMISRGFTGEFKTFNTFRVNFSDLVFGFVIITYGIVLLIIDRGGLKWVISLK